MTARQCTRLATFAVILTCSVADAPRADDGAIEAVGGSLRLMDEHPSIRMVAEHVRAWVSTDSVSVECTFFMHNNGPAVTARVGFPNTSGGADVESAAPFRRFRSFIDGHEVDVKEIPDPEPHWNSYGSYRSWMVKDVAFGANQFKTMSNEYVAEAGGTSDGLRTFEYILSTGGSWKGPIGAGDIVVTLRGIHPDSLLHLDPAPTSRSGQELRWHFENLEPEFDEYFSHVSFAWRP